MRYLHWLPRVTAGTWRRVLHTPSFSPSTCHRRLPPVACLRLVSKEGELGLVVRWYPSTPTCGPCDVRRRLCVRGGGGQLRDLRGLGGNHGVPRFQSLSDRVCPALVDGHRQKLLALVQGEQAAVPIVSDAIPRGRVGRGGHREAVQEPWTEEAWCIAGPPPLVCDNAVTSAWRWWCGDEGQTAKV